MLPLTRRAAWLALFTLCAGLFITGVRSEGRVVCYYTNWSVYRPGTAKFNPQNINPYLCTHLVYAFGGFTKDNQMKPFDKYQDIEQGGYAKFTGLKTYNKQLKTMIAIGGWNEASSRFSPLMANQERRHQFIKNILKFLRQNHFDGIDLDWEYPAHREGGKSRDKDNYAQFVQELRAEFEREAEKTGRPRLLVTMAVPAGIEYVEKGYDIPKLNKYLDWFNVLTYDFHSSHEPSVNHHAPLYSLEEESEYNYDAELNIDYAIKFYLKAGADRDKLVLGIPTYGRTYTLINEDSTELGAPSEGPGEQGDATREKGYLAYYEICQAIKDDPEWTIVQSNPKAMGPYAYRRNQWVGYDDEAIVRKKAEYVVENGLGGIMFWAIDNDDFRGTCTGKPYPLIEAAKSAMLESLGLGINEVAKPSPPKKPSRSRSRDKSSSSRNRIGGSDSEKKIDEYKETVRSSTGRKRVKPSTTEAPSTTIKLTEAEGSSLYIGGRTSTPAPPTTPDPGADFKCEEEGFFQHPRDCKKYFWCLDSGPSGLGIVAHQFTCPSGLYFNPAADSCDFARNVPCKTKKSTTAAPITSTSTTSTTARPTSRAAATPTRSPFFRTTTTTTPAPVEEYDDEEEEEEEETSIHSKDKTSEEDPKVIKELIELIRKVGGIEELEKHLLRKDDGTIAIKENETGASTTASPISKQLYDKVLSRPNTYNSFRNRFASTLRSTAQTKKEEKVVEEQSEGRSKNDDSKYSSVVRSNFRTVPQNDGLDKLSELEGFLKERKPYVTINRNRGTNSAQSDDDEYADEEDVKGHASEEEEDFAIDEEVKSTRRPLKTSTPSYSSIRRSRPTTTKAPLDNDDEDEEEEVAQDKKKYSSFSRTRSQSSTTEATNIDLTTSKNRYKFLERSRPTKTEADDEAKNENDDDEEEEEEGEQENVKLRFDSTHDETKTPQKEQHAQTTTRAYSSIGRRRPTTTAPTTTTTATPEISIITTETISNLDNLVANDAPEPISETTTTTFRSITKTTPTNIATNESSSSSPITTQTSPIPITTPSSSNEISSESITTKLTEKKPVSYDSDVDSLSLSLNTNSVLQDPPTIPIKTTTTTTTIDNDLVSTTKSTSEDGTLPEKAKTTVETLSSTVETEGGYQTENEVTNINKTFTQKTTKRKIVTRTRNKTLAKTNNDDHKSITKNTITDESNSTEDGTQTSLNNGSKSPSNTKDNIPSKYAGGRRQQLFTRRSQIQRQQQSQQQQTNEKNSVVSDVPTTETTPTNNEIPGIVSSPRPFGFPRRRTRRPSVRTSTEASTDIDSTTKKLTSTKLRTTTATQSVANLPRRPVLSVRRRISNTPATSPATTDGGDSTTIESTTTSKYHRQRNRLASTLIPTTTTLATTITTTRNYLNNKSKTKLSTASANVASTLTTSADDAATILPTSANEITQRNGNQKQNNKYSTTPPAFRRKFQTRRLIATTTTSSPTAESATDQPRTSNPLFKRRFSPTTSPSSSITATTMTTTPFDGSTILPYFDGLDADDNVDQVAKSSIFTSRFNQIINDEIAEDDEGDNVVKAIKKPAPPEILPQHLEAITRRMDIAVVTITTTTQQPPLTPPLSSSSLSSLSSPSATVSEPARKPVAVKRRPHTNTPVPATQSRNSNQALQQSAVFQNRRRPHNYVEPFDRLNSNQEKAKPVKQTSSLSSAQRTQRPPNDYDYYDDDDVGFVGNTKGQQLKVILHGHGIIECLDQGNFPHPLSCRKFISCAKFETGGIVGWEYTCPKGLSYDPVGGMCNWTAGLGCKE